MVLNELVGSTRTFVVASSSKGELVRMTVAGDVATATSRDGLGVASSVAAVEERDSTGLLVGEGTGGSSAYGSMWEEALLYSVVNQT